MNDVLSLLTGTTVEDTKAVIQQGYVGSNTHTAGCKIITSQVHSVCKGVVLSVERDPYDNSWCITVANNYQRWIRYCHLSSFKVSVGQEVQETDLLGYAYRGVMRFEYCNPKVSEFPVRVLNRQLYKHDPTPIIFGQTVLMEAY